MSLRDTLNAAMGPKAAPQYFHRDSPVGDTVTGIVTDTFVRQARAYTAKPGETGELMVFSDGTPKNNLIVTLKTDLRDMSIDGDDGSRSVYVKLYYPSEVDGIRDAIDKAGVDDILVGGTLRVQYLGFGKNADGSAANWKIYGYEYWAPSGLNTAAPRNPTPPEPAAQNDPYYNANTPAQTGQAYAPPAQQQPVQQQFTPPPAQQQQFTPPTPAAVPAAAQSAGPVQQQTAAAPAAAAPADPAALRARIEQMLAIGLGDAEIVGALGHTIDEQMVQAVRNIMAAK